MTDKELEKLLSDSYKGEPEPEKPRSRISLVLSPHIVRSAAHLKKKRQDKRQMVLCCIAAAAFLLAFMLLFILMRQSREPMEILKFAGIAAAVGGGMFILCAPVLVWYEEKS